MLSSVHSITKLEHVLHTHHPRHALAQYSYYSLMTSYTYIVALAEQFEKLCNIMVWKQKTKNRENSEKIWGPPALFRALGAS